jgi:hypothetical protein
MDQDVCAVMAACIESVDLNVGHVRKPGERVPVPGMECCKGPHEPVKRQAILNVTIFGNEEIIVVDEFKGRNRPVQNENSRQEQADQQDPLEALASHLQKALCKNAFIFGNGVVCFQIDPSPGS